MLAFPDTISGEECFLYRVSKAGFYGRSVFRTPHGEKGVDYMESQKAGFPDARFSGHHMGRRVLTI